VTGKGSDGVNVWSALNGKRQGSIAAHKDALGKKEVLQRASGSQEGGKRILRFFLTEEEGKGNWRKKKKSRGAGS